MQKIEINKLEEAASRLKALAHPIRIAIIELLEKHQQLSVTEITSFIKLDQASTSHHLQILRSKGFISSKTVGKNRIYQLQIQSISKLLECLNSCAAYN